MNRTDPLLLEMIADAATCADDPTPRMVLTDYLAEQGPTPVHGLHLPRWLERAWLHSRQGAIAQGAEGRGVWGGVDATFAIYADLEEWFTVRGRPACWYLAHHGATTVGGLECFASEPNAPPDVAQKQAECLAARLRCVGLVLPEGLWNRRVVRLLWLPTPRQLEEDVTEPVSEEGVEQ